MGGFWNIFTRATLPTAPTGFERKPQTLLWRYLPNMPMNSVESPVNRLTSSHTDPATNTPAYKETSVHLNVLPEVGESPLPRINFRFGHPTPQNGVEVERKWKRADYAPPGNGLVQLQTKR